MKKKIFLITAMVALLVCVFAISVSAQEIKKFATDEFQSGDNITYLDGINEDMYLSDDSKNNSFYELLDPNFTARAVLKNSDGTYTTYPAWYFITYTHYWNGAAYAYTMERINAFSEVTGETYSTSSVIRYEFPEYKANHTFSLQKSVSFGLANVKYVRVPSHAASIGFQDAKALVKIEYAPGANITSVNGKAFKDCHNLEVIRIPNTATSIGNQAVVFWNTSASTAALKEIYLGASMKTLGTNQAISDANVDGLKIYVPETLDGATYTFAKYFPAKSMLIFTGTKEQAEAFGASKVISYEEYAATGFAHEAGTIVYGYSACDAFYNGVHVEEVEDNNPCVVTNCQNCVCENKYVGGDENSATHNFVEVFEYKNGYFANGTITKTCQNAGCKYCEEAYVDSETLLPLFSELQYSVKNGSRVDFGVYVEYKVNQDAIALYEELSGKTVSYGVVAVGTENTDANGPLNANGTLNTTNNVVSANATSVSLAKVTLIITGSRELWSSKLDKAIYVLGYATDGDNLQYIGSASETPAAMNTIASVKALTLRDYYTEYVASEEEVA